MHKAPDAFRTISEVADELDLPQHVLRFWETRFPQIKPMKRGGGRRYYRPDDVDLLRGIRHLLYGEGYTIRGVQRILKDHGAKFVQTVWQSGAPQPKRIAGDLDDSEEGGEPRGKIKVKVGRVASSAPAPVQDHPAVETARQPPRASAAALREAAAANLIRQRTTLGEPRTAAQTAAHPTPRIDAGDTAKLTAVLDELSECRRMIDAALAEEV